MNRLCTLFAALAVGGWLILAGPPALAQQYPDFTQLVEDNARAVVSIEAEGRAPEAVPKGRHERIPPELFRRFFDDVPEHREAPPSQGSGFVISADGYILTNAHVVSDAPDIRVGLPDRSEHKATLVGVDERTDVALLKIEASGLPVVKIGDSTQLRVGQWVLAIGSPFGFDYSATQGIISALGRSLPSENYVPFIQTDAAVNPGNSGGPLFNLQGEVIGINSQIYSRTGGFMGMSFAIPIDVAMDVADQLRTSGRVSRGWLGVMIQEVTPELAESFGLSRPQGALVGQVLADSPAAKAGLKAGDIITEFEGRPVVRSADLPPMVGAVRPGRTATLGLTREGKTEQRTVTIEELPEDLGTTLAQVSPVPQSRLKIQVSDLSAEEREALATEGGVKVDEVGDGPAQRAGIRAGDVLLAINNQAISDAAQFAGIVADLPTGRPVPVLLRRGDGSLFLALTLAKE